MLCAARERDRLCKYARRGSRKPPHRSGLLVSQTVRRSRANIMTSQQTKR